jgi:peptide-methionine (R)-S-oxide reductase
MKCDNRLTDQQKAVLDANATEPPFSGSLLYNEEHGAYCCVRCGNELFMSQHKFDSGSGWPSFYDVADTKAVKLVEDTSHNMRRVEVRCAKCNGHLGHVFNGVTQTPTNLDFCVNSCVLEFKNKDIQ